MDATIRRATTRTSMLVRDWCPATKTWGPDRWLAAGATVYLRHSWPSDPSAKSYLDAAALVANATGGYAAYPSEAEAIDGKTHRSYQPTGYPTQETYDGGLFFFDFGD